MAIMQLYLDEICKINRLDIPGKGLCQWVFHHGMLFSSPHKWWLDPNTTEPALRSTLHEGVDILMYINSSKCIEKLNPGALVPSAADGRIINICDDFLGQSIVVRHNISHCQKLDLIFVYAHVSPVHTIKADIDISKGDIIASIAPEKSNQGTPSPHLHLSIIEVPKNIAHPKLNWSLFAGTRSEINLINPFFI